MNDKATTRSITRLFEAPRELGKEAWTNPVHAMHRAIVEK